MSKETIMQKIKKGEVKMRPKYIFVLANILLVFGFATVVSIMAFFVNLLIYRYQRFQEIARPMPKHFFGPMFWQNFPWELLLTALLVFVIGLYLYKKFDFSYKHGLLATIGALLLVVFFGGIFLNALGINKSLGRHQRLKNLYERVERIPSERRMHPKMYYLQ